LSPLCVRWKRKRRQVAALQMVFALITQLKNAVIYQGFAPQSGFQQ
jgi:hypothetical protein